MNVSFTKISSNEKTGKIPVSTTSFTSCPNSCPLKNNGCYAEIGPLSWHWKKVTEGTRGESWESFCNKISELKAGQFWRHNQAGDLIGDGDIIDQKALRELIAANSGKSGFTYTHYDPLFKQNAEIIKEANDNGFTINLSANNLKEVDMYVSLNIGPVVTILPKDAAKVTKTEHGNTVVLCPATYRSSITCKSCQLCQKQRKTIVGFPAHGVKSTTAEKVFYS